MPGLLRTREGNPSINPFPSGDLTHPSALPPAATRRHAERLHSPKHGALMEPDLARSIAPPWGRGFGRGGEAQREGEGAEGGDVDFGVVWSPNFL